MEKESGWFWGFVFKKFLDYVVFVFMIVMLWVIVIFEFFVVFFIYYVLFLIWYCLYVFCGFFLWLNVFVNFYMLIMMDIIGKNLGMLFVLKFGWFYCFYC